MKHKQTPRQREEQRKKEEYHRRGREFHKWMMDGNNFWRLATMGARDRERENERRNEQRD